MGETKAVTTRLDSKKAKRVPARTVREAEAVK